MMAESRAGFKSQLCHLRAMWTWAEYTQYNDCENSKWSVNGDYYRNDSWQDACKKSESLRLHSECSLVGKTLKA